MKILLIEDDRETADYILKGLTEEGHLVEHANTGSTGLLLSSDHDFDLLIVDRMLPGVDGLALVKSLRLIGKKMPIIFLTAVGDVDDRVIGLNAGADDYLVKPFSFSELAARVAALGRRPPISLAETQFRVGDLVLDVVARTVLRDRKNIDLQPREFRLLEYLMRHAGQVVTRTMLLEKVWDFHFDPHTNVVESHISRLRGKVDKGFDRELIHTVRGVGYCIRALP